MDFEKESRRGEVNYPFAIYRFHCAEQQFQFFDSDAVTSQDTKHVDQEICEIENFEDGNINYIIGIKNYIFVK